MELSSFLLARFDDDEDDARDYFGTDISPGTWYGWMLAECEAKRMIVRRRQVYDMPTHQPHDSDPFCIAELDAVLLELAQPYADHPDFAPEWRINNEETQ